MQPVSQGVLAWMAMLSWELLFQSFVTPAGAVRSQSETKLSRSSVVARQHEFGDCLSIRSKIYIDAARTFDLNADFDSPSLKLLDCGYDLEGEDTYHSKVLPALKKDSENRASITAIGDKLLLNRVISKLNLNADVQVQQMDVLLWAQMRDGTIFPENFVALLGEFVEKFTDVTDVPEDGQKGCAFILKPTHLSNGNGMLAMSRDKYHGEGWSVDRLKAHILQVLEAKASGESEALQAVIPGVIFQSCYPKPPRGKFSGNVQELTTLLSLDGFAPLAQMADFNTVEKQWQWVDDEDRMYFGKIECPHVHLDASEGSLFDSIANLSDADRAKECKVTIVLEPRLSQRPVELRVQTVWGKAYMGVFSSSLQKADPNNAWVVRSASEGWETRWQPLQAEVEDGQWQKAFSQEQRLQLQELFEAHMPNLAQQAEMLARAFGAPWLRADFFLPAGEDAAELGVRFNEVAYGSGTLYFDVDDGDYQGHGSSGGGDDPVAHRRLSFDQAIARALVGGWQARGADVASKNPQELWEALGCKWKSSENAYQQLEC